MCPLHKQERELDLLEKVWVYEATKCPRVTTSVLKKLNKTYNHINATNGKLPVTSKLRWVVQDTSHLRILILSQ